MTTAAALLGALCCLLAGLAMTAGWRRSPVGELLWDGENWYWESEVYQASAELNAPVVALDLQSAMLLRLDNPAGAVWWLCVGESGSSSECRQVVMRHNYIIWQQKYLSCLFFY